MNKTLTKTNTLEEVCGSVFIAPNTMLVGVAEDGIPVFLNTIDPSSSNVIVWERMEGQGTVLMKTAIEFLLKYKIGRKVEFIVLSNQASEWRINWSAAWSNSECVAVVPFWDTVAERVIFSLGGWCRKDKKRSNSPVILFIDDMESVNTMSENAQENLRYVMQNGRDKNIYVIATARPENRKSVSKWLDGFQVEIYGQDSLHWFELVGKTETILFYAPITNI